MWINYEKQIARELEADRAQELHRIKSESKKITDYYAETGTYEATDLVICEKCGCTFETADKNQDYCSKCRN